MPELQFDFADRPSRIETLIRWMPRVAIAVAFLLIGIDKFAAQSMWVRLFDQIGFGRWFRYLTGTIQVTGALLVLIPRTFTIGIALLSLTMIGAVLVWIFVLHAPGNAPIAGLILVALLIVGAKGRGERQIQ